LILNCTVAKSTSSTHTGVRWLVTVRQLPIYEPSPENGSGRRKPTKLSSSKSFRLGAGKNRQRQECPHVQSVLATVSVPALTGMGGRSYSANAAADSSTRLPLAVIDTAPLAAFSKRSDSTRSFQSYCFQGVTVLTQVVLHAAGSGTCRELRLGHHPMNWSDLLISSAWKFVCRETSRKNRAL